MSIGLGDLNNKKNSTSPEVGQSDKIKSAYKKSITARPWTDSAAVKAPTRSRPRIDTNDLSMSEEWVNLQTEPIFWIDFRQHSALLVLNERLTQIEAKFDEAVLSPIRAVTAFFKSPKDQK